jgi:hypothetical protein
VSASPYGPPIGGQVPLGPRAYRSSLRRWGPFVALIPAVVLGLIAVAVWAWYPCDGNACVAPGTGALVLAALAAPTGVLVGIPWRSGAMTLALALATSAVVWFLLGVLASRRATRLPVADWRDFLREFAWLALGVWGGVLAGLGATAIALQIVA